MLKKGNKSHLHVDHLMHGNRVAHFKTWRRRSPFSGSAQTCGNQSQKPCYVMLKSETKILHSDWFAGCLWSMSGSFIYRHHVEQRVKLYSPRAESFPTEAHWRIQNYSDEFGCQTRTTHRWLLENRWVSRCVWFLDKLKTSRRTCVVRWEIDEKTTCIQASSPVARALEINGKECQAEGETKLVWGKAPSWKSSKIARDLFHRPRGYGIQRNRQECATWKHQSLLLCLVKIMKINCGSGGSNKIKTKIACILKADESARMPTGNSIPHHHQDHIAKKQKIHYNTTIWFTNLFLCLKSYENSCSKSSGHGMGKIGENFGVELDESQK